MANLTTENLKTVNDLEFMNNANLQSGFLLGGEGSTLKKFSYEQLKNSVGSIAVVPVSTEKNKSIGEIWIENEIVNVEKVIYSFSEIGKMSETKQNQVACIYNYLYVLNENGKLFKIDLENKSCSALFSELNFNFIFVNETLIVFVGADSDNTKAINFETNEIFSCPQDEAFSFGNLFSMIDKVSNYSYPFNKLNVFTVKDETEQKIYLCNFIIYEGFLFYQTASDEENAIDFSNPDFQDYSISLMYYSEYAGEKLYYAQVVLMQQIGNIFDPFEIGTGTGIENVSNIKDCHIALIQNGETVNYCGFVILNNSKTHFVELRIYYDEMENPISNVIEKEFYSDENILSEIISLKHTYCGFYTLQKTKNENRFAVVKYNFTTDGITCEVVNIVNENSIYNELDLVTDLKDDKEVFEEKLLNPFFICAGNTNENFIAEKINPEYNSTLKIKMPSGIKKIGLSE